MPPRWYFYEEDVWCPCCDKKTRMLGWEAAQVNAVREIVHWQVRCGKEPPPPVLCVDDHGRPARCGVAVTYRCHTGLIDVGVLPKPGDWKHGWWHPLGRVLWEVKEESS